jgi:hypothetical protein
MSQRSERQARKAERAAQRVEELMALPFVVDEGKANLPARPRPPEGPGETAITPAPDSRAKEKAYARSIHGPHLSGLVYRDQMRLIVDGLVYEDTALDYAADFVERVAPQNALEELLAKELLWSHTRAAALSIRACKETAPQRVRTINHAADGASNTSRRLVRALMDCRRPQRGGDTFMSIGQANVAGQQVVQNQQPGTDDAGE